MKLPHKFRNANKLAAFIALQLEVESACRKMQPPNTNCLVTNSYDFRQYSASIEDVQVALRYLGVANTDDLPKRVFVHESMDELAVYVRRCNPELSHYDRAKMKKYVCGFMRYDRLKKGAMIKCRKLPQYR